MNNGKSIRNVKINREHWEVLYRNGKNKGHTIRAVHVRGHKGYIYNELAHKVAYNAAKFSKATEEHVPRTKREEAQAQILQEPALTPGRSQR
jgi:hypothetical protein